MREVKKDRAMLKCEIGIRAGNNNDAITFLPNHHLSMFNAVAFQ